MGPVSPSNDEGLISCFDYLKGLKKGDVACIFLENRPELLIIYSAMAKIGAVNSLINTNLRQVSLQHCLTLHPAKIYLIGSDTVTFNS